MGNSYHSMFLRGWARWLTETCPALIQRLQKNEVALELLERDGGTAPMQRLE